MCRYANLQIVISVFFCTFATYAICILNIWPFSLMDRISDSDSEDTGSIPVGATKEDKLLV